MAMLARSIPSQAHPDRTILGVNFFGGSGEEAISRIKRGGLVVVPAAPALKNLSNDPGYREALLNADLCLTDSAYMVLIWNALQHDCLIRLSGLEYLRSLLKEPDVRRAGNTVWVMAKSSSSQRNLEWLATQGIDVPVRCVYVAPTYRSEIEDASLVAQLRELHPAHIIVTIGGGTQERLGLYLKRKLDYQPAIHCIGAAIAFLSGDQVKIPIWADQLYIGWLYRSLSKPKVYVPRYWEARKLLSLILRYRSQLPPLEAGCA